MALRHKEPDRVPIDMGCTDVSSITMKAYINLRNHLGMDVGVLRIADVFQQIVMTDDDLRRAFDADVAFVYHEPKEWRIASSSDNYTVLLPARFQPQLQDDGSQIYFDSSGNAVLKMPPGGHYFDPIFSPLAEATSVDDIEKYIAYIENYETPSYLDMSYEELAKKAKDLLDDTDYLLVGFFGGHIFQAGQGLRGWETFLMDLVVNPGFAEGLMDRLVEANMKRFEHFIETVGKYVHVVEFQDDLGMQEDLLISPELYRKRVKPYHQKLYSFVKSRCDCFLFLHTDGAVAPLIPDFIEMGVDILNPVQVSAAGMDAKRLKREFGQDIAFWGAGCDSQTTLPFGTPEQVADEVKRHIDDLAPGGGFVFAPIHNIQDGVPPENIVALYDTAREHGVY